jgi:hypothetical protein
MPIRRIALRRWQGVCQSSPGFQAAILTHGLAHHQTRFMGDGHYDVARVFFC